MNRAFHRTHSISTPGVVSADEWSANLLRRASSPPRVRIAIMPRRRPQETHYPSTSEKRLEEQTKTSSTIHFWLSTTIKGIGTFLDYFSHTQEAMKALLQENTSCFYIKRSPLLSMVSAFVGRRHSEMRKKI